MAEPSQAQLNSPEATKLTRQQEADMNEDPTPRKSDVQQSSKGFQFVDNFGGS
jgi:hypothetical protein